MADMTLEIKGVEEFVKKLEGISDDLRKKGGRFALRKAANEIRESVRGRAKRLNDPSTANEIAKNVAVRWSARRFKKTGDLMFRVGILGGARDYSKYGELKTGKSGKENPGGDTYYWRFLEFGTENARATPFLRPSLADNPSKIIDTFILNYSKAIDRALKKRMS